MMSLIAEVTKYGSLDSIHQLSWGVPLAKLCCIDVPSLPSDDLNTPIGNVKLELKVRSRNGLMKGGVRTVADLLQPDITIQELVGLPNMGIGSAWDVLIHLYRFCHRNRSLDAANVSRAPDFVPVHALMPCDYHINIIEQALAGAYTRPAAVLDELDGAVPLRHLLGATNVAREVLGMPVEDLQLSARASNCLFRQQWNTVDDLLSVSVCELFDVRNMGATTVWEIVSTLFQLCRNARTASVPSKLDDPANAHTAANTHKSNEVVGESVADFVRRVMVEAPDRHWTASAVEARLMTEHWVGARAARAAIDSLPQLLPLGGRVVWLEGDEPGELVESGQVANFRALLDEFLAAVANGRNIGVLSKYFGLDGPHQTLQQLSDSSAEWNGAPISRERVRQIIQQTQKQLRKDARVWSLLAAPLRNAMADMGGIARFETVVSEIAHCYGETWGTLSIEGYARFVVDTDDAAYSRFSATQIKFPTRRFVLAHPVNREAFEGLLERAKAHLDPAGGPIADEMMGILITMWWPQVLPDVALPRLHPTECLFLDFDIALEDGCWRRRVNKRGHKLTVIDHLVAIMREHREPMHFTKIGQAFRQQVREITDNSIHGRLSANPDIFALIGPGTFGLVELGYKKVRWVRDIIADFLQQRGRPASLEEIKHAVWAEREAEASSVFMILTLPENNRGLFKRFPDNTWGLSEWMFGEAPIEDKEEKAKSLLSKLAAAKTDTRQQKSQSEALLRLLAQARTGK